jgi:radical SAM superfamily enzyme YgiQ (UPF0313 family)
VTLSNELARNGRRSGLTFAPEAGSERMRAVINKMVSEEDMLRTAEVAFSQGWRHCKLYFMVGLPTEEDEDVLAIADLGIKVWEIARKHGRANKVTISVGGFVPKPHTPFQWAPQGQLRGDPAQARAHPSRHPQGRRPQAPHQRPGGGRHRGSARPR